MNSIEENDPASQGGAGSSATSGKSKSPKRSGNSRTGKQPVSRDTAQKAAPTERQRPQPEPAAQPQPAKRDGNEKPTKEPEPNRGKPPHDPAQAPERQEAAAVEPRTPNLAPRMLSSIRRAVNTFIGRSNGPAGREPNVEQDKGVIPQRADNAPSAPESVNEEATQTTAPRKGVNAKTAPSKEETAFTIPQSLQQRYLINDDKYYFRDRQQALAFEDKGARIATGHDDAAVARSMVELAAAKGWQGIKIKGTEPFKREAWLAASERGLETTGYRPKEADRARLAEIMAERQAQDPAQGPARNSIERKQLDLPLAAGSEASATVASKTAAGPEKGQPKEPALSQHQMKAIDALKSIMQQRGDSPEAIDLTARMASEELQHRRTHVGKLVEHGSAPYKHDKDEQPSYYVVLDTPRGQKTVWGVDLKRQLQERPVAIGTDVVVSQVGQRDVTVTAKERDADHQPTGKTVTIDAVKNKWEMSTVDQLRDQAAGRGQRTPLQQTANPVQRKAAPPTRGAPPSRAQQRQTRSAPEREAPTR
jgi:putative DNA primase/helicase